MNELYIYFPDYKNKNIDNSLEKVSKKYNISKEKIIKILFENIFYENNFGKIIKNIDNKFLKNHNEKYKIISGNVYIGGEDAYELAPLFNSRLSKVKIGVWEIYSYIFRKKIFFYVTVHNSVSKNKIKNMKWKESGEFGTDIARGGVVDVKFFEKETNYSKIEVVDHGFYCNLCRDGMYDYWVSEDDNGKIIGIGFKYC